MFQDTNLMLRNPLNCHGRKSAPWWKWLRKLERTNAVLICYLWCNGFPRNLSNLRSQHQQARCCILLCYIRKQVRDVTSIATPMFVIRLCKLWLVGTSIMDKMLFSYSKFPLLMNTSSCLCLLLPRYIFRSTFIYRNMYYRPRPLHKYSGYRHFVHFGVHTQTRLTQLWPVQYLRNRNETKFLMCAALLCLIYSWQDK